MEFNQPAIIAEALAEAASHDVWISDFLQGAEKAAQGKRSSKSMVALLDEIRADQELSTAAHWEDGNKIRDGIMKRAPDEMIKYASQWTVEPDQLEERTAEMINAAGIFDLQESICCAPADASSLFYRWCSAPSQADQIRLLLHALRQQLDFLLLFSQATMDQPKQQGPSPGMEKPARLVHVRIAPLAQAVVGRNHQLQAQGADQCWRRPLVANLPTSDGVRR